MIDGVSMSSIKVVSFDQSTDTTGYAVYEDNELVRYGSFVANSDDDIISRIEFMYLNIRNLIETENPDHVIFEGVQYQRNLKSYSELSWLQGVILAAVFACGSGFEIIMPSSWRKHFGINKGKGVKRAELKARAMNYVKTKYGLDVPEDVAEGILIGRSVVDRIQNKTAKISE